jgi:hypothetical protein
MKSLQERDNDKIEIIKKIVTSSQPSLVRLSLFSIASAILANTQLSAQTEVLSGFITFLILLLTLAILIESTRCGYTLDKIHGGLQVISIIIVVCLATYGLHRLFDHLELGTDSRTLSSCVIFWFGLIFGAVLSQIIKRENQAAEK